VTATPILELIGVRAAYGRIEVLRGVDLSVPRGAVVALLGANGAGKTTLLKVISGLMPSTDGDIHLAGVHVANASPEQLTRAGLCLVPEGRGIFPNLSVRENLTFAARMPRDARPAWTHERVLETFPRLRERHATRGHLLSGGEQQMLAIGRALMTNPELLILDEATEGLAPQVVHEIWRIVGEIRQSGIASLIVDRNYGRVLAHTDRAVVLEKGVVVLEDWSASLAHRGDALARHLGV
jgi:branched-chain amino acid transport system ATP-binding protein